MKEKIKLNELNQLDKNRQVFYAWKLGERSFDIQIIMTVVIFFYNWKWLNINFFLSVLIGIAGAFFLSILLDISIFRILHNMARRKEKDNS